MINVRRQQKKQKVRRNASKPTVVQTALGDSASDTLELLEPVELPSLYQPSRTPILQQYLVSHFISLNARGKSTIGSFFRHIPQLLSDSTLRPLKQAIMAVVTNHYGATIRDKSIQMQSRAPYIAALNGLLKLFLQAKSNRVVGAELGIATSIFLLIYELRTGETNDGWINHGRGAERLFLTLQPEVYQVGPAHNTVRFLRYVIVSAQSISRSVLDLPSQCRLYWPRVVAIRPFLIPHYARRKDNNALVCSSMYSTHSNDSCHGTLENCYIRYNP